MNSETDEVLEINKTRVPSILDRGVRGQVVSVHEPRPESIFRISVEGVRPECGSLEGG